MTSPRGRSDRLMRSRTHCLLNKLLEPFLPIANRASALGSVERFPYLSRELSLASSVQVCREFRETAAHVFRY
jgi:hypothetical protein